MDGLFSSTPQHSPETSLFAGTISVAPGAVGTALRVALSDVDGGRLEAGPARWTPRVELVAGAVTIRLPEKGDSALVAYDDMGDPWVLQWWPKAYAYA